MQVLALRESPFDRRHEMASVRVDTAGAGRTGHRLELRYLGFEAARAVHERLAHEAGSTSFRW